MKLPQTQEEANELYRELDSKMCDEVIFRDGEATWQEARAAFNEHLIRAAKIYSRTGFRPPDGDVFLDGQLPTPMPRQPRRWES